MRTRTSCALGVGRGDVIDVMDWTPAPAVGRMKVVLDVFGGIDMMGSGVRG